MYIRGGEKLNTKKNKVGFFLKKLVFLFASFALFGHGLRLQCIH